MGGNKCLWYTAKGKAVCYDQPKKTPAGIWDARVNCYGLCDGAAVSKFTSKGECPAGTELPRASTRVLRLWQKGLALVRRRYGQGPDRPQARSLPALVALGLRGIHAGVGELCRPRHRVSCAM